MKILVVEDDRLIRHGLVEILEQEGYDVTEAGDGRTAMSLFRRDRPDFVCLDIMLPHASGYEVCREIRRIDGEIPIVFITAKSQEVDKVLGLDLGADDFIVKPFGVKEVIARIRAIVRRCQRHDGGEGDEPFQMGALLVIPRELRARRNDETIDLSLRDVKILQLLHERSGQAVNRKDLFDRAWGTKYLPNSRTLDQHVSQLRKRIEVDPTDPQIVKTVHGVGYRFDSD